MAGRDGHPVLLSWRLQLVAGLNSERAAYLEPRRQHGGFRPGRRRPPLLDGKLQRCLPGRYSVLFSWRRKLVAWNHYWPAKLATCREYRKATSREDSSSYQDHRADDYSSIH